jgi:hypothetical protein
MLFSLRNWLISRDFTTQRDSWNVQRDSYSDKVSSFPRDDTDGQVVEPVPLGKDERPSKA